MNSACILQPCWRMAMMLFIEYRWHKTDLVLMHTLVPEGHEGKGIAGALAKFAPEYARDNKLPLLLYCPYVKAYMKRHPEYDGLLVTKNN